MNFQVTLQPSGHTFDVPEGDAVLAAGLAAGWNLPYSCRAGTCRTCRGKLLSGQVAYKETATINLDEMARQKGYALLCRAIPLSNLVVEVGELSLQAVQPKLMPARVKRIERPVPGIVVLGLRLPMNANFKFAAGQFIDIQLPNGKARSYSMANPPSIEGVIDIELHVRQMPGGLFSEDVISTLKEGDILRLRAPLGTFYLREESNKPVILLASGTGFAPLRSIILYAQQMGFQRPMKLYWGNRTPGDFYAQPPEGVECVRVVSGTPWEGRTGLVHEAVIKDHPDLSGHQVYACGAPAMVDAARRTFTSECGLPESEFFADSFLTKDDAP
ncbi:2Fe-2S iron-sulfur cluster-binding protein [Hydrogenophaga sp. XSHU_21]